jgi:uncharacterized membrane protein YGL010W
LSALERNLVQYAAYHRDRRNIATHLVGVPTIVFSGLLALTTFAIPVGPLAVTGAAILSVAMVAWYLWLDRALGVAMALAFFAMCAGASEIAPRLGAGPTLALAAALFTGGWALQFLGHKFEGMKPAFFDDVKQLLVGPLFVCAELAFLVGARAELRSRIEAHVGPTVARRTAWPDTSRPSVG